MPIAPAIPFGGPLADAHDMLADGNFYGVLRALRRLLPLEERLLAAHCGAPAPGRVMVQ